MIKMQRPICLLLVTVLLASLFHFATFAENFAVGDVIIVDNDSPYYKEEGAFTDSGLKGYEDSKTRYSPAKDSKVVYSPPLANGKYKVSVFKLSNTNSVVQIYTVTHKGKSEEFKIDFSDPFTGLVELGTFEFWGNGTENVTVHSPDITSLLPLRVDAVKFELVSVLSDVIPTPPPGATPTPAPTPYAIPTIEEVFEGIGVTIDYVKQNYEQPPVIINSRTMVPMRGIFEALDSVVMWNGETQTVTAIKGAEKIVLTLGSSTAFINDKAVILDVAPQLYNDRTMVPVRFVSEALGCKVEWIEEKNKVEITTDNAIEKTIFLDYTRFQDMGTWTTDGSAGTTLSGTNLRGQTSTEVPSSPATATIYIQKEGLYRMYVRSRGFTTTPEARFFNVNINGVDIDKTFGQHGINGWMWEEAGTLDLKPGKTEINLIDSSQFYARMDGIILTCDPNVKDLPENMDQLSKLVNVSSGYDPSVNFPTWAKTEAAPVKTEEISNENVKIQFFEVPSELGNVVQKTTHVKTKTGFEMTTGRENHLGNLLMYANEGKYKGNASQYPMFELTFNKKGSLTTSVTSDIFNAGRPYWLIPSTFEKTAENTAVLTATSDVADATFTWELKDGDFEPTVTFKLTPKVSGSFSCNLFEGSEKNYEDTNFILSPLREIGRRLPASATIITQKFASVPLSLVNLPNKSGKNVNLAVMVDPSMMTTDWVRNDNNLYGFGIKGPQGGVMPSLVAPLHGSEQAVMTSGDEYQITYRLYEGFGDWFDGFSHFVTNVFDLKDYRENYYGGLTDAVLNTTKLALDPKYSGWDTNMKVHYNIEGRYSSSQSNPIIYLSSYLLSEDESMLDTRAIPSLAYILTRQRLHFTNSTIKGSGNPGLVFDKPQPIGMPTQAFGTTVVGGAYEMTRGYNDVFKELWLDNGPIYYNAYGSIPRFSDQIWAYKYTGNKEYLEAAKKEADIFIERQITNPPTVPNSYDQFIAIGFYPNFQALIDLYEITGEQKYLDAASEGGKMMLTTVWVETIPDKELTIRTEAIKESHFNKGHAGPNFYYGEAWRIGYPDALEKMEDETVPFWLTSRTGLSIEQTSTFEQHNSGNIMMTNWAADLMRLYAHTKEPLFEVYARNAVIGRYTNYPGYYYNQYQTVQMKPEYPYEGPDITGIYWHHIPPFLSMIQDFLITQAFGWSDKKITFPSIRQQGYAYFSSREYGVGAGQVFDQDGMWPWLKEGLIASDNVQIDWFAARKDNQASFILMNQSAAEQTATLSLGSEIEGGSYTGDVIIYDKAGNKSTGKMENSKITLSFAGHDLKVISLSTPTVKAPAFATVDAQAKSGVTKVTADAGETVYGYLLQVTPSVYHAYAYTTKEPDQIKKAVLNYKIGDGAWQKAEQTVYPFEFIIKVSDVQKSFTFNIEEYDLSDKVTKSKDKTMVPKK